MTIGKMLTGLALIAATATQCSQPVRARRDYGLGWDKEVALYNVDRMLRSPGTCNSLGGADESNLRCGETFCAWGDIHMPYTFSGQLPKDVGCLKFLCCANRSCSTEQICLGDKVSAEELVEAMEIYLQEIWKKE